MIPKKRRVAFADILISEALDKLNNGSFEEKELYKTINSAMDNLLENPFCYIKIQREKWPKEYIVKYNITNLWKYNLRGGWRLIYTIKHEEVEIIAVILEWFSHKDYERKFGY